MTFSPKIPRLSRNRSGHAYFPKTSTNLLTYLCSRLEWFRFNESAHVMVKQKTLATDLSRRLGLEKAVSDQIRAGFFSFFLFRFLLYLVKFGALRCSAYEKYLPELCSVVCPMLYSANKCTRIVVSNPPEGDQLRSGGDSRCIYGEM